MIKTDKQKVLKAATKALEITVVAVLAYLLLLPAYPLLRYKYDRSTSQATGDTQSVEDTRTKVAEFRSSLPDADYAVSPDRLIIAKIGVNAPIVESADSVAGLNRGAWRVPESSTPDQGGNTVISGHRFKYLPPNNMTFYLLDKLESGDVISILWHGQEYYYRVRESRIVPDTEVSIMDPTSEAILTLFTCHPIYSTEQRLVVVAVLADE